LDFPKPSEQSPLKIELIAISYPLGVGHKEEGGIPQFSQPEPSSWVLKKYQEFGEYLGASYEGYESEVMSLLCAIELLRRKKEDTGMTPKVTMAKKGSRELKNLVSTINYEGWSSKRQIVNSGGSLLLTCQ
jgi:hypothetical protein